METKIDPHNYERQLKSAIRLVEESDLSERNKKIIFRFKDHCVREGLSKPRVIKLLILLRIIGLEIVKDFDKAKRRDIERYVTLIQEKDISVWTKHDYKVALKKFYKWLKQTDDGYPEEVKWIKTNVKKIEKKLPRISDLLKEDEVKNLINNADHPRNKAFIALLYESGCRISELLTLKIRDVSFDEHGVLINVTGKTGSRKIRVIASTSYLTTWINSHPFRSNLDNPLWINYGSKNYNKPMIYKTARKVMDSLFKKCNINKRSNPHLFRHSRATFLANHFTEFQMNQYFGWVQGSETPSTYVHLSGRETDNTLLLLNGFQGKEEHKESTLKPIKCPRCDHINGYDSKFCSKCAGILDIETAMKLEEKRQKEAEMRKESDEIMNMLMRDPEVQKLIMEKIATMGLDK